MCHNEDHHQHRQMKEDRMKTRLQILLIIAAIVAVCGVIAVGFAQTGSIDTSGSKVQLVTVYEKTFADSIVDVVLDEAWVTQQKAAALGWKDLKGLATKGNQVQVSYPKVVVTKKAIDFYSVDGTIKKKVLLNTQQEVLHSKSGQYLIRKNAGTLAEGGAELFDCNGTLLGRVLKGQVKEVSDSGTILVAENIDSETGWPTAFVMYDKTCRETGRFKMPDRFANIRVEGGGVKLSEDGGYFIVGFGMFGKPDSAIYYLVDKESKVLWLKEAECELQYSVQMNHIVLKDLGILSVVERNGIQLQLLDWYEGTVKWTISLNYYPHIIKIDPQNKNGIILGSSFGYVGYLNAQKGEINWQHVEEWATNKAGKLAKSPSFRQISVLLTNRNKNIVVINGINKSTNKSTIYFFDAAAGQLLAHNEYSFMVRINCDTRNLSLIKCKSIELLEMPGGMGK